MYYISRSTFPVYASFEQQRRLISGMIFAREKTSVYKPYMYKQIGTIFWNSFVIDDNMELFWVTFDPSVATLSISIHSGHHETYSSSKSYSLFSILMKIIRQTSIVCHHMCSASLIQAYVLYSSCWWN